MSGLLILVRFFFYSNRLLYLYELIYVPNGLGTDHYFFLSVGLPFLALADNFFCNAFQTIFFITFCNENNFLQPFLKSVAYRSDLKKKTLLVHAYT